MTTSQPGEPKPGQLAAPPGEREPGQPAVTPGERKPGQLAAPPGDRYRPRQTTPALATAPDLVRASIFGILAGLATAAVFAVLAAVLDARLPLLVVGAVGGLGVGLGVRRGAWYGLAHVSRRSPSALAVGLALVTWVGCQFGAYLLSLATLAASSLTFSERLASQPFLDWLSPQFGAIEILELFLLAGFAWYSSR